MTQKDPGGDVIEDIEGERLISLIEESGSMAVYFCKLYLKLFFFKHSNNKQSRIGKLDENSCNVVADTYISYISFHTSSFIPPVPMNYLNDKIYGK